jgi:hypothetical protein
MDTQNDVPRTSHPAPEVTAGSPAAGDPAPSAAFATTNSAPPGDERLVVNGGIAGTLAERSLPDVPGPSSGARAPKHGAEFGAAFPEANGRAPAAVAPLETASSAQPEADLLNVILCGFGDESEMPLAELCDFVGFMAAGTECEPRELVEDPLRQFQQAGAVTFLPTGGAGGGAAVRLDLSKSAELRQRAAALREEVAAVVRAGEKQLANGRSLEAAVLYMCLEYAVGDRWDGLTRQAIAGKALDRIAASPAYEIGDMPDLTVRLRKHVPAAPDGRGAKASEGDTEQPLPGRPVAGDAGDDLLPQGSFQEWPRLETAVLLDFRQSPRRSPFQLCHTEDDSNGGVRWRPNTPAAAGGKDGTAPDGRAAARAPETPAAAAPEAPGGAAPGAVGLEPRAAPRPTIASESPANTTLRNCTMKNKTKATQHAAPDVVVGPPDATGPAPAETAPLPKAAPPTGELRRDNGGNSQAAPELPFHPVTALFPSMSDAEYQALKEDIQENGQHVPIWTYQDQIIDGRHRYRACRELGVPPKYQEWDGSGSLVAFVWSLNVPFRQLSESQLAMAAARAKPMFEEEARQRMRAGKPADPPLHEEEGRKGEAADFAARMVGGSRDMVYKAQAVLKKGIPELQRAVDADQVSVSGAALLADLDKRVQRKVVDGGSEAMEKKVKELRAEKKSLKPKPGGAPGPAGAPERPAPGEGPNGQAEGDRRPAGAVAREGAEPQGADAPGLRLPEQQRPGLGWDEGAGSQADGAAPGGAAVVNGDATAESGHSPSGAAATEATPGEGLRILEAANQFLGRYEDDCSELLRLPRVERERYEDLLGLLAERARTIVEELAKVGLDYAEEDDPDSETAE